MEEGRAMAGTDDVTQSHGLTTEMPQVWHFPVAVGFCWTGLTWTRHGGKGYFYGHWDGGGNGIGWDHRHEVMPFVDD